METEAKVPLPALPANVVDRARLLWGRAWFLPLIPTAYTLVLLLTGREVRIEHLFFVLGCIGLGYATRGTKALLVDLSPYVAVGLAYDLVRYLRPVFVLPERVWACGLRQFDLMWGSPRPGLTVGEVLASLQNPVLDLVCAIPYTIFVYLVLLYAGYLFVRDRPRMRVYLLAFAIANYISFVCWLLIPAAPPWYVHTYGCSVDLATAPHPAGLARVDELFGIHYYREFYARASTAFGAMPSMHCAYPVLGLVSAWRAGNFATRGVHLLYAGLMAFAAMYLDHHWLADVFAGWLTAVVAVLAARWWLNKRSPPPA